MAQKEAAPKIDAKEYMNIRKVLSDKDYYLYDEVSDIEITDLLAMMKVISSEKVTATELSRTDRQAALVMAFFKENCRAVLSELSEYGKNNGSISISTLNTLKFYADICFYNERPDLFDDLCMAVYNDASPVSFGPVRMPGGTKFPRTYESTYRMLLYDMIQKAGGKGLPEELFSPDIESVSRDFFERLAECEPADPFDAYKVYEFFKEIFLLQERKKGRKCSLHTETDKKRLDFYSGDGFDAEKLSFDAEGIAAAAAAAVKSPSLAYDMSDLACCGADAETIGKYRVRRTLFESIAETGILHAEVTVCGGGVYSLQDCIDILGPETFLDAADAGFYMHIDKRMYKGFQLRQRIYDLVAGQ